MKYLNSKHVAMTSYYLTAVSMADLLKKVKLLDDKHMFDTSVSAENELLAFNTKKKFMNFWEEISDLFGREAKQIDDIVMLLLKNPNWLSDPEDLEDVLEELRAIVGLFCSVAETVRVSGEPYLNANKDSVLEFSTKNKVLEHTREIKLEAGWLAIGLRARLVTLSKLLKVIQSRWNWLNLEERHIKSVQARKELEEKKEVIRQRKKAREEHKKFMKKLKAAIFPKKRRVKGK